jgi:hypothetical protein
MRMPIVTVPLLRVPEKLTVKGALDVLRDQRRSGLVVEQANRYRLLHTGDLLEASEGGVQNIAGVNGEPVFLPGNAHARRFQLDLVRPLNTPTGYAKLFREARREYAAVGISEDAVMLLTRDAPALAALTLTGGYCCDGSPRHFFPRPAVSTGQHCPRHPLCKRADGRIPTVHPV